MVVGEPTLMGGEFGDEDERLITRLENQQFDTVPPTEETQGQASQQFQNSPGLQSSSWGAMKKSPPTPNNQAGENKPGSS